MVGSENEGITNSELCLPLNERSFLLLIQQYNEEAAAARAVALRRNEDDASNNNSADLALAAQYMEDLARDTTRLYKKLQEGGGVKDNVLWTEEDVNTLRMLGFDVRHIGNSMSRNVHDYTSKLHSSAQKFHTPNLDALLSVEQKIQQLQEKVDMLTTENLSLRRRVSKKLCKVSTVQNSIHNTSDSLTALTEAFNGLKDAYYHKRHEDSLIQKMREKFALALHDIRAEDRKLRDASVKQLEYPYTVIEDAFRIVQSIDACQRVRYCIGNNNSNIVEEPVDTAVIQLLNDLDFSFPINIRRLGPGGDYFIDQHVEIKLVDGQLLVRPRLSTIQHLSSSDAMSGTRYEHLAKYLIHLYSPAMDLEKVAGKDDDIMETREKGKNKEKEKKPNTSNSCDARDNDIQFGERVASLRQQQRDLRRTLNSRYEQLQQHQQQLELGLSSSQDISQLDHITLNHQVQSLYTEEKPTMVLNSPSSREDRVAHTLLMMETNGKIPDLSTLSESELRRLKRAALRRQMRTLQGLSGVVSPRLQSHSL